MQKTVFVTGAAGFIGYHLVKHLLEENMDITVVGIDSMNDYYDISLKEERLKDLKRKENFIFRKGNIVQKEIVQEIFAEYEPEIVINLAAQPGVRYSIINPDAYIESNIIGFYNILEACRHSYDNGKTGVRHLVFASSSSVYGANKKIPYSTEDKVDNPVSLYAATKKSDELLAHAYAKLYHIPTTGLRFFTVYGPLGRPDMAYFKFTNKLIRKEKIQIYNYGDMYRDFTYVDDVAEGICRVMCMAPEKNENGAAYKIYNIGNNKPESLKYFVETLEEALIKHGIIDSPGEKEYLPMQPGDVYQTYADIDELIKDTGFAPRTSLKEGLDQFAEWYRGYYIGK